MKKKIILITNIVCYSALLALWGTIMFGLISVALGAANMDSILIWYEKDLGFGNFPFNVACIIALLLITFSVVYGLAMQEKYRNRLLKR